MTLTDTFQQAFRALTVQPVKALLIILAMSVGITSVIILTALGESTRLYVIKEFQALGSHLIIVLPGRTETTGGQPPIFGETPRDLTLDDAKALTKIPHIVAMAPVNIGAAPVSTRGLEREVTILGSTAALRQVRRLKIAQGRFLSADNDEKPLSVCVIGQTLKKELFAGQSPLGKWLRINDRRFRVIGVLASEGQSIGLALDDMVIIPVASAQALFDTHSLFRILLEARSEQAMYKALDDIKNIIKTRHDGEDDVTLITQDSIVSTFNDILNALTLTVVGIAGISLTVAGILVMNVMWINVSQRTAEIGLLKALGASQSQILWLFLSEAAILAFAGGLTGVLLGKGGLMILQANYPEFPIYLPLWAVISGLLVALITSLVFGILPARKAALMNPVTALRQK